MLPALIVFDLDACLWSPEMFELSAAPTSYDGSRGGVAAGRDTVRLFPGAVAVLQRLLNDSRFKDTKVAVASSTTEPVFANTCLNNLRIHPDQADTVGQLVGFRQINPGSKGRQHFPKLKAETGIDYGQMVFFDDCTYSDNCADVASSCPGVLCVRTPKGLTEDDFDFALKGFAEAKKGVLR
eukprot:TRINITY_DN46815_c0_g1_i1.p1 TRINITY_DN46815_c0_g1~~TRINITY_DN46815_c0_g1_i1.p1  ORF type:complete len:213 (-),score=27.58 TRINITY_DN46815_c0_g1_i1:21-566(-)